MFNMINGIAMKKSNVLKAILIISGVIAIGVGVTLLFTPITLYASVGVDVSNKVSLLSDLRATGGALLASGALIAAGAFRPILTFTSTVFATLLYLSYGLSRIYGMFVDGIPDLVIVQVAVIEIVIGIVCLFALVKYRD